MASVSAGNLAETVESDHASESFSFAAFSVMMTKKVSKGQNIAANQLSLCGILITCEIYIYEDMLNVVVKRSSAFFILSKDIVMASF